MVFFGKKKNKEQDIDLTQPSKPSESLGTVLSESVPAAALDIIRTNEPFNYPATDSDMTCYVVATLDVADIGGLNKHMKSDPDKGQFIECIANGRIQVFVSEEGIEAGKFVIIPTESTLRELSEFSFLADKNKFSKFIPTYVDVDQNGNMTFREIKNGAVPFQWFVDIMKGHISCEDAIANVIANLPEDVEETPAPAESTETATEATAEATSEESVEVPAEPGFAATLNLKVPEKAEEPEVSEPEVEPEIPEEDPVDDETPEEDFPEEFSEPVQQEAPAQPDYIQSAPVGDPDLIECPNCHNLMNVNEPCPICGFTFDGVSAQDEAMEAQDTVEELTDVEIQGAVERLFHAGDLDLQITAQPFDMQYVKSNEFVPISEDRGDKWLDGYATQLAKNANVELKQLHNKNMFLSRERFLLLMTDECEKIAQKVNIDDSSNIYFKMKKDLLQDASSKRNNLEMEVDKRRTKMQDEWDKELAQIQESAAAAAKRNYIDKHSKAHEAALRNVEVMLSDEIDIEYQKYLTMLNEKRRTEAKRLLDIAVTQTLIVVGDEYRKLLEKEDEARDACIKEIERFCDEHRKDEMTRVNILDEELKQKNEADKVTEEYTRRIQSLTSEHDATCDKLRQEIEASRKHEETVLSECKLREEAAESKTKDMDAKYNDLMDRYVAMDAQKAAEYETRMNTLENDKKAAEEHLLHVDAIHNKYNKVAIIVWVAIAVAMFAIGTLVGSKFLAGPAKPASGSYSIQLTAPQTENQATDEATEGDAENAEATESTEGAEGEAEQPVITIDDESGDGSN